MNENKLVIKQGTKEDDTGNYTCFANNNFSSATKTFPIVIAGMSIY